MIKQLALAFSIAAMALSTSFAECDGQCTKDDGKTKEPVKEPAARTIEF